MKFELVLKFIKEMKFAQIEEFMYNKFSRPKTFPKFKNKNLQSKILVEKGVEYNPLGMYYDHIEMSGLKSSAIISYGIDKKNHFQIFRHITFPYLRLKPNMTTSSACHNFNKSAEMLIDGVEIKNEVLEKVNIKGNLELTTNFKNGLRIVRTEIISKEFPALIEKITITNITKNKVLFEVLNNVKIAKLSKKLCINGDIQMIADICGEHASFCSIKEEKIEKTIVSNASFTFYNVYCAIEKDEKLEFKILNQIKLRNNFIDNAMNFTSLKTPLSNINALYSHCQIRGNESIFDTDAGKLHSPGGGNYYASIWANDQLEYVAPVTPFLGNKDNLEAAQNAINLYISYMDRSEKPFIEKRPVPSSIISGGLYPFGVAGDRGDSAMVGLGIAQFLLNNGDIEYAKKMLWAVEWSISYCDSRTTDSGVVASDSDELEGRFPSGKCNLSTNINYYLLLKYAIILENELDNFNKANEYKNKQIMLKQSISNYFEAKVEGYDTYRYYENNKVLRSWICLPLIAEIFDKKEGTIKAITEKLYQKGELKTASNKNIVWDRSLLFALRGMFLSGESQSAIDLLSDYSTKRLLGAHSPYPYEAYPEGNGAQLSGESVLYLRVIIEGMFGIKAIGFGKLKIEPNLPIKGNYRINNLSYLDKTMDIEVENNNITFICNRKIIKGKKSLLVDLLDS
jgi:hypothetical protein